MNTATPSVPPVDGRCFLPRVLPISRAFSRAFSRLRDRNRCALVVSDARRTCGPLQPAQARPINVLCSVPAYVITKYFAYSPRCFYRQRKRRRRGRRTCAARELRPAQRMQMHCRPRRQFRRSPFTPRSTVYRIAANSRLANPLRALDAYRRARLRCIPARYSRISSFTIIRHNLKAGIPALFFERRPSHCKKRCIERQNKVYSRADERASGPLLSQRGSSRAHARTETEFSSYSPWRVPERTRGASQSSYGPRVFT